MYSKKITAFLSATTLVFFLSSSGAKSAEECFENVSRGVFQFNLTVDRAIIEPIAKGYNKLPEPIKMAQVTLRQILLHFLDTKHNFARRL